MFKRKRITVLGVSLLAALGLMSVSAAGAQAGQWTIDGKALGTPSGIYTAPFQSSGGVVTIISGGITIKCAKQLSQGELSPSGKGTAHLILYDCVFSSSDVCLIPQKEVHLLADMILSKDGSQVVFWPSSGQLGRFGSFWLQSVEEECPFILGDEELVKLSGSITANIGAPGVQLPVTFPGLNGFIVELFGLGNSTFKGTSSMSLTGANAGKVLGTSS